MEIVLENKLPFFVTMTLWTHHGHVIIHFYSFYSFSYY